MVESILTTHAPFFTIGGIIENVVRYILWILICLLTRIADGVESIVNKIYTVNSFFNNPQIEALINKFKPAFWLILTLSIVYIGYKIVVDREYKGERIFQNFLLSSLVIVALPTFMVNLNNMTMKVSQGIIQESVNGDYLSTARTIIKNNLYDVKYLESKGFKLEGYGDSSQVATNNIKQENILNIPINATISNGGIFSQNHEVYKNKLELDENGERKVVKLDESFFGLIDEEYYRFNFDFMNMIVSLLCLILTFILTAIKVSRIIVELAFKKIFAITLAFGDVASGQKLKTVLKDILSSFAIIFATALLLKIYMIGSTWVGTLNTNIFVKLVFTIALSIMVIDAPNIIEQILGIDAGIKSGWSLIAGAYAGIKGMSEVGNSVGDMLGKASNTMIGAGATAKGVYDGFKGSTLEEERNNLSNNKDNQSSNSSTDNSDNTRSNDLSDDLNNMNSSYDLNSNDNNSIDGENKLFNEYGEQNSLSEDVNGLSNDDNTNMPVDTTNPIDDENSLLNTYGEQSSLSEDVNGLSNDDNTGIQAGTNNPIDNENGSLNTYGEQNSLSDDVNSLSNDDNTNMPVGTNNQMDDGNNSLNIYGEQNSLSDDVNSLLNDDNTNIPIGTNNQMDDGNNSLNTYGEQSLLSDEKQNINGSTLSNNNNISSNLNDNLESDINKANANNLSENGLNSDVTHGTLDNDNSNNRPISNDKNLENNLKNNDPSKSINNDGLEKQNNNNKSDKDLLKNSNKLETRSIGEYAKDKISSNIKSSKPVEISKKYYQLGVNTGSKLKDKFSDMNKLDENKNIKR